MCSTLIMNVDVCFGTEDVRSRPVGRLDFYCSMKEPHCLYSTLPFSMETKQMLPWIHLKYLHLQVRCLPDRILFKYILADC